MKFKYMIRGLGLGMIVAAVILGAYSRNAVADARVAALKDYGLEEEKLLDDETSTTMEESLTVETTEPVLVRDQEKESEIYSALDAAKESEQGAIEGSDVDTELSNTADSNSDSLDEQAPDGQASDVQVSDEQDLDAAAPEQESSVVIVVPSDEEAGETAEIVIESGDDSGTVSRKLQNAGIIENASEYDAFLMQHGYDKKISTGKKVIGINDTWQEIADKISRRS